MASSPSSQGGHHRRRQNSRRQPLARTNTFFGAIKNIVTAPLSWFASTDDFEDSRDSTGKRRRLAVVPTEPALEEEEQAPRTKRMRVDSPPREPQREGAYLDPPTTLFEQPPSISRSVFPNAQSTASQLPAAGITGNYVRSTLSPLRNLSVSRTMSIDPPPRPQSRDGGAFQSQRPLGSGQDMDSSMESVHPLPPLSASSVTSFPRVSVSMPRDLSVPNSRPPFRMRTSLTPQPAQVQRERSEPPPLQLLRARPTFVKPPPIGEGSSAVSNEPGSTLGSLVESVRRTQSPAHQHSSLLFGGKTQVEPKPEMSRAQKALHELEIYKTPLLPTRLRNGAGQAITGVPDLFRPRKKLVLMKDEDRTSDRKLGRKESGSPDKNGTKPYAGAGGMKKMLAKRKLELEETGEDEGGQTSEKVEKVKEKEKDVIMEAEKAEPSPSIPKEVPPPPKDDWYSLASGPPSSTGASSLRVGRAKLSRNHISRPIARTRAKFSAAFEEEGDDLMLDEQKEKEMLDEAAKKAPVFNISADFSFATDMKPIEHDATGAKEPPIKSLPFSFATSPAPSAAVVEKKTEAPAPAAPSLPSQPPPTTTLPFSFEVPLVNAPPAQEKPNSLFDPPLTSTNKPTEGSSSNGGVPNFFARSIAFNTPLEIKTSPLTFGTQPTESSQVEATAPVPAPVPAPSPPPLPVFSLGVSSSNGTPSVSSGTTSLFGSPAPGLPVKDAASPFWDGEKKAEDPKKDQLQTTPGSIFGVPAQEEPADQVKPPISSTPSLLDNVSKATVTPASLFSAPSVKPAEATKPPTFSFGGSSTPSLFGAQPTAEGNSVQTKPAVSLFGTRPSVPSGTSFTPLAGGRLFGASSATDTTKPVTSPFRTTVKPTSEPEKPTSGFGATPSAPTSTTIFSFGQQTPAPVVEAPRPIASSNGLVPFGTVNNEEAKPASPSPFKFGGPENETKAGSPTPFNFGAPSTPQAAEKSTPFTFGTPTSPPVFTIGVGASTAGDVSKPLQVDRPVTPPKNSEQEFKMEESPTREVQQANADNKLTFSGFNFGNPPSTSSVLFGGPTSAPPTMSNPFPFSSSSPSNPFIAPPMKESKSEGPKPFSFGQPSAPAPAPAINTGFTFGQTPQKAESPRPSTAGSFGGFGGGGGTPTSTTSGFNFGAPVNNPFGQQSGGSAPSSPSIFQPSGFNFGSTSSGTGFGFGSQPASPATGSTNLPPSGTPFGTGTTGFNSSAPSSPFSAPTQIAPSTSSGGTLFTIGAAPPPQQVAQGRQIKKLPTRNRGKR